MKYLLKLLTHSLLAFLAFPTLVLASSSKTNKDFLSFDAWKAEKIKIASTNHSRILTQFSQGSQKKQKGKKSKVRTLGNDLQSAQLALQTAKNLRLDDYLAVYWAPRASTHSIEKVALGLTPAQVKELLTSYMNSSGLSKTQSLQPLINERVGDRLIVD